MWYYSLKVFLSAVIIVLVSEVAKRSSLLGALIASLPLTSLLAIAWLYMDTKDSQKVIALSYGIFWILLPSLVFFIALPFFLRLGYNFWLSLGVAIVLTGISYGVYVFGLGKLGVRL